MQAKNQNRISTRRKKGRRLKIKHSAVAGLEAELVRCVRADGSISRVDLARKLKLAPSTVSIYVDRLIAEGFLFEKDKVERTFGRPPKAIGLNSKGGRFIGVDFEARNIMATAVDFSQRPLKQFHDIIRAGDSVEKILQKIENAIHEVAADDERRILGIGVGVPGSVDHARGIALHYRHIPGWDNIPLSEKLSDRFGAPVYLENNSRSMALAELWFGEGRSVDNFICIGIRSGIGAGIILDGHLYRGTNNVAGEIADWPCVLSHGRTRLEDLVSLRTIKNGDFAIAAQTLALALCQLNLAFNPAKIILAGTMTSQSGSFLDQVKKNIADTCAPEQRPIVINSSLGEFNGALGAAALAVHQWKPVRA